MGNLASVSKAVERAGASAVVSSDEEQLGASDVMVLPGVGNFAAGIERLSRLGLDRFLIDWAEARRPLLGICLGMQLLFEKSEEGSSRGLGILPGDVVGLAGDLKVPHMGWNNVDNRGIAVLEPFDDARFYFVHSYVCRPAEEMATAVTEYGGEFVAAVERGNVVGFQFHPEKSGRDGLALLARALRT